MTRARPIASVAFGWLAIVLFALIGWGMLTLGYVA